MDLSQSNPDLNTPYPPSSPTMSQVGAEFGPKEEEVMEQMRKEEDRGSTLNNSETGARMDLSHNEADSLLRQSWNSYSTNLGQFYGLFEKNPAKMTFLERFEGFIQSDITQICNVMGPPSSVDIDQCLLFVKDVERARDDFVNVHEAIQTSKFSWEPQHRVAFETDYQLTLEEFFVLDEGFCTWVHLLLIASRQIEK